ncbi:MAG: pantetheine-phosphate adenylyltransferase [Nitrososphaerota archaeon]
MYEAFLGLKRVPRDLKNNPLWSILVELVKSMPLYGEHKAYVREVVLMEDPDISFGELSALLNIPIGEAMVILDEVRMWREDVEEEIMKEFPDPKYSKAAIGGTFNEVHYGHLMLVYTALKYSERLVIGVTGDEFVKTLVKSHPVSPYNERIEKLASILSSRNWLDRCEIVMLRDAYGPTIEDESIELLVVSPMTYTRAIEINDIRVKKGLKPLDVIICPLVLADDGKPISSTRIMDREIDHAGRILKQDNRIA